MHKTKIIIFNKAGRVLKGHNFIYGNNLLEHVNEYIYSIYFRSSGIFTQGIKYFCNEAIKAIFCTKKALISDCMSTCLYVFLYNHCVSQFSYMEVR